MGDNGEAVTESAVKTKNVKPLTNEQYALACVLFTGCFCIGLKLPDIDLVLPFMLHRSIITHSFILPVLLVSIFLQLKNELRFVTFFTIMAGINLGIAIHLSFDLFPVNWHGYALISVPIYGRTSILFSILWIAGNVIFCLFLSFRAIIHFRYKVLATSCFTGGFYYSATSEPGIALGALTFLLTVSGVLIAVFKRRTEKQISEV